MAKIEVEFDDNSLKILKDVPEIHRISLINIGLSLASKTSYYKTLTGEVSEVLTDIASLESIGTKTVSVSSTTETGIQEQKPPKAKTSWDSF